MAAACAEQALVHKIRISGVVSYAEIQTEEGRRHRYHGAVEAIALDAVNQAADMGQGM